MQQEIKLDPYTFWLRDDSAHTLFTASFDIRKNHFSGLMVFNPLPGDGYRVIFLTEFGLKIFDMEYAPETEYTMHYVMPALDRKGMIRLLQNDLMLLPAYAIGTKEIIPMVDRRSGTLVMQAKEKGHKYDCLIDENSGKVNRIIQSSRLFRKVEVNYFSSGGNRLDSVIIRHYHMKLNIKLIHIDEIPTPADGQALSGR